MKTVQIFIYIYTKNTRNCEFHTLKTQTYYSHYHVRRTVANWTEPRKLKEKKKQKINCIEYTRYTSPLMNLCLRFNVHTQLHTHASIYILIYIQIQIDLYIVIASCAQKLQTDQLKTTKKIINTAFIQTLKINKQTTRKILILILKKK